MNWLKKCEKAGILTQTPEKNMKFVNSMFQKLLFEMLFTKKFIYIFVISTLSTQTLWFKDKLTWDFSAFT